MNTQETIEQIDSKIIEINKQINSNDAFIEKLKELNDKDTDQTSTERRGRDIFVIQEENASLLEEKIKLLDQKFNRGEASIPKKETDLDPFAGSADGLIIAKHEARKRNLNEGSIGSNVWNEPGATGGDVGKDLGQSQEGRRFRS